MNVKFNYVFHLFISSSSNCSISHLSEDIHRSKTMGKWYNFKEIITLNLTVLNGFGYITPEFETATEVLLFGIRSVIFVGLFT